MLGPPKGEELPPLTKEDWKKIEKSMKKPEFLGLLSEYMVQISDPKNKKEYDDYLRQMEQEGELPKHMKLVQPQPEFCVKTALVAHSNRKQQMKFFINMCSASEIDKPNFQMKSQQNGQAGQSWKIPNSMGKIRYDQDNKGAICNTVDAVFNPDVFQFSNMNKKFQALIINIAIETAQKQLGQRKENLSKDYIVLQNVKCKGDQPALLPVRSIEGKVYNKGEGGQIQRDSQGKETKLQKEINDQKKQQLQLREKQLAQVNEQITEEDLAEPETEQSTGPVRPKFSTIYSYPMEYMDYLEGGVDKSHKIPSAFNIEFKIPLVSEFTEITSLDVNEEKIVLSIGKKYYVEVSFQELKNKYKLINDKSKAKFDKKKKVLRVSIPVDKTSVKAQPPNHEEKQQPTSQAHQQSDQKDGTVLQDNTWQDKNKILEISQGNVAQEFISRDQTEEALPKKFVQEIDQDDTNQGKIVPQEQVVTVSTKPTQFQLVPFKCQEAKDKTFMIVHLPKYKKDEVRIVVTSNKIMLLWHNKYLKAQISRQVEEKDIQTVFVVDYVVVNISKSAKDQILQISPVEEPYEIFIQDFEKEEQAFRARMAVDRQSKVQQQHSEQVTQKDQIVTTTETLRKPDQQNANDQNSQIQVQQAIQPQFIHFKISLVDELD